MRRCLNHPDSLRNAFAPWFGDTKAAFAWLSAANRLTHRPGDGRLLSRTRFICKLVVTSRPAADIVSVVGCFQENQLFNTGALWWFCWTCRELPAWEFLTCPWLLSADSRFFLLLLFLLLHNPLDPVLYLHPSASSYANSSSWSSSPSSSSPFPPVFLPHPLPPIFTSSFLLELLFLLFSIFLVLLFYLLHPPLLFLFHGAWWPWSSSVGSWHKYFRLVSDLWTGIEEDLGLKKQKTTSCFATSENLCSTLLCVCQI